MKEKYLNKLRSVRNSMKDNYVKTNTSFINYLQSNSILKIQISTIKENY